LFCILYRGDIIYKSYFPSNKNKNISSISKVIGIMLYRMNSEAFNISYIFNVYLTDKKQLYQLFIKWNNKFGRRASVIKEQNVKSWYRNCI